MLSTKDKEIRKMKVIVGTEKEISALIAEEFIKQVNKKPNSVLGLATGTSPLGVYANLVKANKEGRVSFKNVESAPCFVPLPTSSLSKTQCITTFSDSFAVINPSNVAYTHS